MVGFFRDGDFSGIFFKQKGNKNRDQSEGLLSGGVFLNRAQNFLKRIFSYMYTSTFMVDNFEVAVSYTLIQHQPLADSRELKPPWGTDFVPQDVPYCIIKAWLVGTDGKNDDMRVCWKPHSCSRFTKAVLVFGREKEHNS